MGQVDTVATSFKAMLDERTADPSSKFHIVPTQGTVKGVHWANELHPHRAGFRMTA